MKKNQKSDLKDNKKEYSNKFNRKKLIFGILLGILLGSVVSISYAIFSYTKTGANQQLITGDIYMHYKETNTLTLQNVMPSNTYDANNYFEFTRVAGTWDSENTFIPNS